MQVPSLSSLLTKVYNPKTFFLHAASLDQAFAHCPIFPTAASRRSLGRVSVPMWPFNLSVRLLIVDLVGRYPANCLIRHEPISKRIAPFLSGRCLPEEYEPCLSSIVAVHPLRPATDRRLGGLLPRQPANQPQTPPPPTFAFIIENMRPRCAFGISNPFGLLCPREGQIICVLLTRSPLESEDSRSTCMC